MRRIALWLLLLTVCTSASAGVAYSNLPVVLLTGGWAVGENNHRTYSPATEFNSGITGTVEGFQVCIGVNDGDMTPTKFWLTLYSALPNDDTTVGTALGSWSGWSNPDTYYMDDTLVDVAATGVQLVKGDSYWLAASVAPGTPSLGWCYGSDSAPVAEVGVGGYGVQTAPAFSVLASPSPAAVIPFIGGLLGARNRRRLRSAA